MRRASKRTELVALAFAFAFISISCGDGDSPTQPSTRPPPPPTPSAVVQTSGNGTILIAPSIDPAFCCTTIFPVKIEETGGGTAIWNFFRVSYLLNGAEVERSEVGSNIIRDGGFRDVSPSSTMEADVLVRSNVVDFDDVRITMGFADTKDGRTFEETMDLSTFDGVGVIPIPAVVPEGATAAVVRGARE